VGFVEGETGSCTETGVECDDDGNEEVSTEVEEDLDIKEEVSIKFEEAIDIKDEIPEPISFPPIKTEQEVRLWFGCDVVVAYDFRPFIAPKKETMKLHSTISCFVVYFLVPFSFKIWFAS
jgi:hypothetical protein